MSDQQLLNEYLAGRPEAMERVIRGHIDMVYATARRHVGAADADDITQAVFVMLVRKSAGLRHRESLAGWLYRCTIYCCSNFKRMEGRRRKYERESNAMSAMPSGPSDSPDLRDLLDDAMARLGAADRDAVLLRHLEQKTLGETALQLGISEEAARKRAARGLARLRDFFVRKGYVAAAGTLASTLTAQAAIRAPAALTASVLAASKGVALSASAAAALKGLAGMYAWTQAKAGVILAAVSVAVMALIAIPLMKDKPPLKPAVTAPAVAAAVVAPPVTLPAVAAAITPAAPPPPQVIDVSTDPEFTNLPYQHVTVNFDNATPADAAAAFGKAIHLTTQLDTAALEASGNELPPLSMHLTDVPLMHAVMQFSRIAHAYPQAFDLNRLTLRAALEDAVTQHATVGRWSVAGPFAAEIGSIQTGAGRGGVQVLLRMAFFAEPGVPILRYPDTLDITEFTDDKGQAITAEVHGAGHELIVPLTLPAEHGSRIASLKGRTTFLISGPTQPVNSQSLDELVSVKIGGMNVEILPASRTEPRGLESTRPSDIASAPTLALYHFQVRYHRGDLDAKQWAAMKTAIPSFQMTILNEADQRITSSASRGKPVTEDPDTLRVEYTAASAPPEFPPTSASYKKEQPHHVRLEVPDSSRAVAVPFRFTDLPLP